MELKPPLKSKIQEYVDRAKRCEQLAAESHDLQAKTSYIEAANCWRELAAIMFGLSS
jgi:hypothetical protein